jgi:hypothetical protein
MPTCFSFPHNHHGVFPGKRNAAKRMFSFLRTNASKGTGLKTQQSTKAPGRGLLAAVERCCLWIPPSAISKPALLGWINLKNKLGLGKVVHACISSTWETEAGGSWVWGQPGLHSQAISGPRGPPWELELDLWLWNSSSLASRSPCQAGNRTTTDCRTSSSFFSSGQENY